MSIEILVESLKSRPKRPRKKSLFTLLTQGYGDQSMGSQKDVHIDMTLISKPKETISKANKSVHKFLKKGLEFAKSLKFAQESDEIHYDGLFKVPPQKNFCFTHSR